MSASQFDEFDRRMRRISRRHTQLSKGYVTSVNGDGLVVAKPRRKGSRSTLRGLAIVVLVMFAFKGFLHSQLGAANYNQRVANLAEGSVFEQVGSWVMAADPVTLAISAQVAKYI